MPLVVFLCACAPHPSVAVRSFAPPERVGTPAGREPGCQVKIRQVSTPGRGGVRPAIASSGAEFAVVWEETSDDHRGVHFAAFDPDGGRVGPSVEVADLERGGADPQVVAGEGGGYAVLWTADRGDGTFVAFRRVDRRGRPLDDVVPAVTQRAARPIAATPLGCPAKASCAGGGFAVGWWSPTALGVTFVDAHGKARGPALELERGAIVDPALVLRSLDDGRLLGAWVSLGDSGGHLTAAELSEKKVGTRADLGAGDRPALLEDTVVFGRLSDSTLWRAPVAGPPAPLGQGVSPAGAGGGFLCFAEEGEDDGEVLRCGALSAKGIERPVAVTRAEHGFITFSAAAAGSSYAVAYQTEEDEARVGLAVVKCP
jgi:hypothetical protein